MISSPATQRAVFTGMAKLIPWAMKIMAELMPITRPRLSTSGPPELPGLRATSVWMTFSISRPERPRSERPSAETTPADTVLWKPSGLPMAMAICPTRTPSESPSSATGRPPAAAWITARSVAGSAPTSRAGQLLPSVKVTVISAAPSTTWALVRMNPSGAMITPEPAPSVRPLRRMAATAGPTRSTTSTTARE